MSLSAGRQAQNKYPRSMARLYFINMKKLTTVSLFIFWAVVTAILTAGLVFYQNNKNSAPRSDGAGLNNSASPSPAGASLVLNAAEIAKHNSAGDCWLLIDGKIYNVSSYLSAHPGGAGIIIPLCGKEATQVFNTKGGRGAPHSDYAASLLINYLVGDLNQTVSEQQIKQTTEKINSLNPPSRGRGDNEFDD